MVALEQGGALVTMLVTEAAQDVLPCSLGLRGQLAERHRVEIRMYQRSDGARFDVPRVRCGLRGFACHRVLIRGHKVRRPRQARQRNVSAALAAKVEPRLAVAVYIAVNVLWCLHCFTTSHSLKSSSTLAGPVMARLLNSNDPPSFVTR